MGAWLVSKVRVFLFPHRKENLKGEKYFENIHENYVPNFKYHLLSPFVTKDNEVRKIPNTSLHQNSVSKKNIKLLKNLIRGYQLYQRDQIIK